MVAIQTQKLTKYYGKNRGIIDVDISVGMGEIYGFIGPNGAGKSTLIRTLLNFLYPTSGKAYVLGKDIEKSSKEIKENVAYVPSEIKYYENFTALEILNYANSFKKGSSKEEIKKIIDIFSIEGNKKIRDLSLGNKKKIALGQALLGSPKLLILDEPTSGLDPLMQKTLFQVLIDFANEGNSVFLSSHNLTEVGSYCHRASIIKEGRIVDTVNLKSEISGFGRIIEVEGNIPEEVVKRISSEIIPMVEGTYRFIYKGEVNDLIQELGKYDIKNLSIRKENIEDKFLVYYGKESE